MAFGFGGFAIHGHVVPPQAGHDVVRHVGLAGDEHKLPGEISGGMRKLASLARALVLNPQIILCDEPDSGLDPVRTAYLSQLLIDINAQIDATILILTVADPTRPAPALSAVLDMPIGPMRRPLELPYDGFVAGQQHLARAEHHVMAITQIRRDTPGRTYYLRKRAYGKNHAEAMRCLKRRLSDVVEELSIPTYLRTMRRRARTPCQNWTVGRSIHRLGAVSVGASFA